MGHAGWFALCVRVQGWFGSTSVLMGRFKEALLYRVTGLVSTIYPVSILKREI